MVISALQNSFQLIQPTSILAQPTLIHPHVAQAQDVNGTANHLQDLILLTVEL
jgi:hypothetical protein